MGERGTEGTSIGRQDRATTSTAPCYIWTFRLHIGTAAISYLVLEALRLVLDVNNHEDFPNRMGNQKRGDRLGRFFL